MNWSSIPSRGKGFLSSSQRPDRLWSPFTPIQRVQETLSLELKQPGHEIDRSPEYSA
jgi:hypothetical protein